MSWKLKYCLRSYLILLQVQNPSSPPKPHLLQYKVDFSFALNLSFSQSVCCQSEQIVNWHCWILCWPAKLLYPLPSTLGGDGFSNFFNISRVMQTSSLRSVFTSSFSDITYNTQDTTCTNQRRWCLFNQACYKYWNFP